MLATLFGQSNSEFDLTEVWTGIARIAIWDTEKNYCTLKIPLRLLDHVWRRLAESDEAVIARGDALVDRGVAYAGVGEAVLYRVGTRIIAWSRRKSD